MRHRSPASPGRPKEQGVPLPEFTMKSPDDASCNIKLDPFVVGTSNAFARDPFEVSGLTEAFFGLRVGFASPTRVDSARANALQQAPRIESGGTIG
ncbi:MAG TPA: hypothetical protein VKF17_10540, partial [Isosphaeraceae bacterium]|nr:hypothetical protein [Isosphaeraceae bacterium]